MAGTVAKVNLFDFTFQSLYFCGTPLARLRGDELVTAVNQWYMPLIRSGWAVPLAFVVDVGTLLLRPGTAFQNRWKENVRPEVKQLALDYYKTLQAIRRHPVFVSVTAMLAATREEPRRVQAVKTFLRFLLAELAALHETYSFDTREFKLKSGRPVADGVHDLVAVVGGKQQAARSLSFEAARQQGGNQFGTVFDLMRKLTDYYRDTTLGRIISEEERLMIEVAGRSPWGTSRVDYHFLQRLLATSDLADVTVHEPRPRMVQQIVPTDSYQVDGPVSGYIDINARRFSGNLAEVLPMELAMLGSRTMMYQKLLNEGPQQFIRENIECIEQELRVLFCFIIDGSQRMMRSPADLEPRLGQGMTPYLRARTLAAGMIRDLARFMPRAHVKVDFGLYVWSREAEHVYRTEFDPFAAWSPAEAGDRFQFARQLIGGCSHLFYNRVGRDADRENVVQDRDPAQYMVHRHESRSYHCRHLAIFTSTDSADGIWPETDPGLVAADHTGDTLLTLYCDVNRVSVGVDFPYDLRSAQGDARSRRIGELTEKQVRERFLEAVLLKGAGKSLSSLTTDMLDGLS
jgi:hypothetical protein